MKKSMLGVVIGLACTAVSFGQSSIQNHDWKGFLGGEVNDTLTWHMGTDSSFVTNSHGDVMVKSKITVTGDKITITDYDGQYACTEATGSYTFTVTGNSMSLKKIEDGCEGRAQAIDGLQWTAANK
ncbi:MAG TPA: hypothetical protein VGC95_10485 [Chitinophagaceae bacterium]|jgi:hypothetical protein